MEFSDLLNADMATVGAQLGRGFAWWTGELAAMVPRALRSGGARARTIAQMQGGDIVFVRDGRRLAAAPADGRVTLAVPRASVLVREVVLPRLPRADTRRLLALDLDRLTPLDPATAVFDFEALAGDPQPRRQRVALAVMNRSAGAAALMQARAAGLDPQALGVADGEGGARFDFLPGLREGGARAPLWAQPRTWWIAAAVLLLANIAFAVWRDSADVARVREAVDAQSDAVQLAQRAKARVRGEDARRALLLARRAAQDPLGPLAAATAALPPPAWVQRLAWDGHVLRLIGFTTGAIDPIAALRRSGAFTSVRASTADIPSPLDRYQPFDVSAERGAPAPAPAKPPR